MDLKFRPQGPIEPPMRPNLLHRLLVSMAPLRSGALRVEVCPPAAWRHQRRLSERLHDWFGAAPMDSVATWKPRTLGAGRLLAEARREFVVALDDIRPPHAGETLNRIRVARSLHELWYLRSEVFSLVSRHHDQAEASRRLAALNRHFPSRARRVRATGARAADGLESMPPL
jgi:hypothetical protein